MTGSVSAIRAIWNTPAMARRTVGRVVPGCGTEQDAGKQRSSSGGRDLVPSHRVRKPNMRNVNDTQTTRISKILLPEERRCLLASCSLRRSASCSNETQTPFSQGRQAGKLNNSFRGLALWKAVNLPLSPTETHLSAEMWPAPALHQTRDRASILTDCWLKHGVSPRIRIASF